MERVVTARIRFTYRIDDAHLPGDGLANGDLVSSMESELRSLLRRDAAFVEPQITVHVEDGA